MPQGVPFASWHVRGWKMEVPRRPEVCNGFVMDGGGDLPARGWETGVSDKKGTPEHRSGAEDGCLARI